MDYRSRGESTTSHRRCRRRRRGAHSVELLGLSERPPRRRISRRRAQRRHLPLATPGVRFDARRDSGDPSLAGFGGRWLGPAAAACVTRSLPSGIPIRAVPPVHLLATKLEAFSDRGNDDCLSSHDFEDIILLIDSREELAAEMAAASDEVKSYIRAELTRIAALRHFDYGR
jgi:hypothetical protein